MSLPSEPKEPEEPEKARNADEVPLFRSGRVHISTRRRGADITALGHLALHLPHGLASLAVVFLVSYVIGLVSGIPWWLPFGCWVLSGALVFSRPCERLLARWLFRLRYPAPEEERKLRPVWREVAGRAGVDANGYQLWIENSDDVNALAAAGHIVSVTSHSLATLTPVQLGSVLAHELGHHARGHAWASLLALWYALPARIAWRLLLRLASRVKRLSAGAATVAIVVAAVVVLALATATYGLIFLPLATPYLVAAVSRRAELRADEHAAGLGFAAHLLEVLRAEHDRMESRQTAPEGVMMRLLDSHPDVHTRMHHLQAFVERRR
ncbi:M48 family metalloprotease [Streptomyces sp. SID13726]|uniref:M48 family metalloprotease n=1 Tax=Streptomyces sp. SID13726 TaxID=2706058 RepID=UPI0013BBDD3F|nr:M48 family metalloprotease [Streptomyces sp. SID13726]NEB00009.1 M48 family metalloprotease [Streptomyces sp. SID13726]